MITSAQLFDTITPLWLALHRKGVLDISETALAYEDVLAKRRLENGESADSTAFLQEIVRGLHRVAASEKTQQR